MLGMTRNQIPAEIIRNCVLIFVYTCFFFLIINELLTKRCTWAVQPDPSGPE